MSELVGQVAERSKRSKRGAKNLELSKAAIKENMIRLGCNKVTQTVPYMVEGILRTFMDDALQIISEAAHAESSIRRKKSEKKSMIRLERRHMNFLKADSCFREFLGDDVHFRNVWEATPSSVHAGTNVTEHEAPRSDRSGLLACEKPERRKEKERKQQSGAGSNTLRQHVTRKACKGQLPKHTFKLKRFRKKAPAPNFPAARGGGGASSSCLAASKEPAAEAASPAPATKAASPAPAAKSQLKRLKAARIEPRGVAAAEVEFF